jgi:hypothetical protein
MRLGLSSRGARVGLRRSIFGIALAALACGTASAQTGGLGVLVVDAQGRTPLPGAIVTLTSDRGLVPGASVATGADGIALFPILPIGPGYRIEVAMPGYARVVLSGQSVGSGDAKTIPVALLPEQVEHETVRAERSVVELTETSTSTKFDDAFLNELPIQGRFYQNMLTMAPGVQDSDGDGNPNVHGARSRDFKATVDGISNQDPLTGQWLSQVNPDSIEAIEVLTAGAGAEFGRAQGGFGRIVQKQGSNDFEGVAGLYYRTSKLDGAGAANIGREEVPAFDWFQPSVQVSGPILRDKLWYRLSHEYIDVDEPVNVGSAVLLSKRTQQINADQITWQVSPRTRLAFQVQSDPLERTNVGVTTTIPEESGWSIATAGPTYAFTWTAAYSPKLFVESQVAYQDHTFEIEPTTSHVFNDCVLGLESIEDAQCFNSENGLTSGSYFVNWHDHRQRFTAKSQATFYAGSFLGMRHEIKTGVIVENERYIRDLERTPDIFVWAPTSGIGGGPPHGVAIARFAVPGESTATAVGTSWGAFAEDRFRPAPNVTASIGVRYDVEQIDADGVIPFDARAESQAFLDATQVLPEYEWTRLAQTTFTAYEGIDQFIANLTSQLGFEPTIGGAAQQATFWNHTRRPGNLNLDNRNVSPRVSVSWDPWSDGKTKVAATAGRYYDKIFLAVPLIELEPVTTSLFFDTILLDDVWRVQALTRNVNPAVNAQVVDRDLKTPYKDEYTLSFEREIARETSVKLTYVRSKFRDQLQDMDINSFPGDFGRCNIPKNSQSPAVLESPGMGQYLIDPYTGKLYQDTDPGNGDGITDDCTGLTEVNDTLPDGSILGNFLPRADGIPDLYVQNPAWGSIFLVGNFNEADYHALVLELVRRQFRSWQLEGSYTYSKAVGDAEDFQVSLGDDRTTLVDEHGYLSYDQRHVVKVNAAVITPWNFRLGIAASWQSGLPYSILAQEFSFPVLPPIYSSLGQPDPTYRTLYPTHQRNDQRNPSYWNFDVRVAKDVPLPKGMNLQLTAEIFNLLNDDTVTIVQNVNGAEDSVRRFGRQFQLGFRISF